MMSTERKKFLCEGLALTGLCDVCVDELKLGFEFDEDFYISDLCPSCADIVHRLKKELRESGHYHVEDN